MNRLGADIMAALMWPVYDVPALFRPGPFDLAKIAVIGELAVAVAFPLFGWPGSGRKMMSEIEDLAFGYLMAAMISFVVRMI